MIVRSMRWGYDGGGMACGPVEGTYIVELMVTAEDKRNYFVVCSILCEFIRVEISEVSLFDLEIEMNHSNVDFDYELEKVQKLPLETYDTELQEDSYSDQTMFSSLFAPAIRLALAALKVYCSSDTADDEPAENFIGEFIGKDISSTECATEL